MQKKIIKPKKNLTVMSYLQLWNENEGSWVSNLDLPAHKSLGNESMKVARIFEQMVGTWFGVDAGQ